MQQCILTFHLCKLRIQCEIDFRGVDTHQFTLVGLDIAKVTDNLLQDVVGVRTDVMNLTRHKLMNGENVRHLDIQRRLRFGVKVVELVDVEIFFCVLYRNHCDVLALIHMPSKKKVLTVTPDLAQPLDRLSNISIQRLKIDVFRPEQPSRCYLRHHLGDLA